MWQIQSTINKTYSRDKECTLILLLAVNYIWAVHYLSDNCALNLRFCRTSEVITIISNYRQEMIELCSLAGFKCSLCVCCVLHGWWVCVCVWVFDLHLCFQWHPGAPHISFTNEQAVSWSVAARDPLETCGSLCLTVCFRLQCLCRIWPLTLHQCGWCLFPPGQDCVLVCVCVWLHGRTVCVCVCVQFVKLFGRCVYEIEFNHLEEDITPPRKG